MAGGEEGKGGQQLRHGIGQMAAGQLKKREHHRDSGLRSACSNWPVGHMDGKRAEGPIHN